MTLSFRLIKELYIMIAAAATVQHQFVDVTFQLTGDIYSGDLEID